MQLLLSNTAQQETDQWKESIMIYNPWMFFLHVDHQHAASKVPIVMSKAEAGENQV